MVSEEVRRTFLLSSKAWQHGLKVETRPGVEGATAEAAALLWSCLWLATVAVIVACVYVLSHSLRAPPVA